MRKHWYQIRPMGRVGEHFFVLLDDADVQLNVLTDFQVPWPQATKM